MPETVGVKIPLIADSRQLNHRIIQLIALAGNHNVLTVTLLKPPGYAPAAGIKHSDLFPGGVAAFAHQQHRLRLYLPYPDNGIAVIDYGVAVKGKHLIFCVYPVIAPVHAGHKIGLIVPDYDYVDNAVAVVVDQLGISVRRHRLVRRYACRIIVYNRRLRRYLVGLALAGLSVFDAVGSVLIRQNIARGSRCVVAVLFLYIKDFPVAALCSKIPHCSRAFVYTRSAYCT